MLAYLPALLAPLLFMVGFMLRGRRGGTHRQCAYIGTRERGTRTPAMGITVGSSSSGARIERTADGTGLTLIRLDSRPSLLIGRGVTTADRGVSGERRDYAVCDD